MIAMSMSFSLKSQNLNTALLGHWGYGNCGAVAEYGNYAYLGMGNVLVAIDKTNAAFPFNAGELFLEGSPRDIFISGNYAYLVDTRGFFRIIDIANPASLHVEGFLDMHGATEGVAISGNYAYITMSYDMVYQNGLHIVNISTPASPNQVATLNTGYVYKISISGNYAYLTKEYNGLGIVDISNSIAPSIAGTIPGTVTHAYGVAAVTGNYIYLAAGNGGLRIFNISNPSAPILTGEIDSIGPAVDVAVYLNHAFVAAGDSGVRMINISNPAGPYEEGYYLTNGIVTRVDANLAYTFIADIIGNKAGMRIISNNYSNPLEQGSFIKPVGDARGICTNGNYSYMAHADGLVINDISNPANPQAVGLCDLHLPNNYLTQNYDVQINGNYAFVGDEAGLFSVDISNPVYPQQIGFIATSWRVWSIAISGNYAYLAIDEDGIRVINITSPATMTQVGLYDWALGNARSISISGNYAYVANGDDGVRVLDISDPYVPVEVGSFPSWAMCVTVNGNYAYIGDSYSGVYPYNSGCMRIANISNPASPLQIGAFYLTDQKFINDISINGSFAYLATSNSGTSGYLGSLEIVNIANPASPSLSAYYTTLAGCNGVNAVGNQAYLTSSSDGLLIITPLSPASAGTISGQTSVCQGQNSITYSVTAIANASSYLWTLPFGTTGTSTSNTITVNFGINAVSGYVTVKGQNIFNIGDSSSLAITVNPLYNLIVNPSICQGDYVVVGTHTYYTSGNYIDSLTTSFGCDSIITTHLTVNPAFNIQNDYTFCQGGFVVVGTHTYSTTGNYLDSLLTTLGCDSIIATNLTVTPLPPIPVITQYGDTLISNATAGNQWFNLVTGYIYDASGQTYLPQQTGSYFVIVALNGCYSDTSNIIYYVYSGMEINENSNGISVYPNPAKEMLSLNINQISDLKEMSVSIYNIQGQLLIQQAVKQKETEFNISRFAKGLYIVKVNTYKDIMITKFNKE